jgi:hypothetical protein
MPELLETAQDIEKMGIIAILSLACLLEGVVIVVAWNAITRCHKNMVRILQGKEVD